MTFRRLFFLLVLFLLSAPAPGQEPVLAPGDQEPILTLEAQGPTSQVMALAFSPDGKTLYAGGFDKVVRTWTLNDQNQFVLGRDTYRVPVGPGLNGAINALALSPDGRFLAVGGLGVMRGLAGHTKPGFIWPQEGKTPAMHRDEGLIFVFDTRDRTVRLLSGSTGPVLALAFAPDQEGKTPLLVSAAREWSEKTNAFRRAVRLWNLDKKDAFVAGKMVLLDPGSRAPGDPGSRAPGLAVRHTGQEPRQLEVALAWGDRSLRLWDVAADVFRSGAEGPGNTTAVYLPGGTHLLTGNYSQKAGRLRAWKLTPGQAPQPDDERQQAFPDDPRNHYPLALTLTASKPPGPRDRAAVILGVVSPPSKQVEYRLGLLDLGAANFGQVDGDISLGNGPLKPPILAAAPRSGFLAVALPSDPRILVYATADVLARRARHQTLQGVGTSFHQVAFMRRAKGELGLLLREPEPGQAAQPLRQPAPADRVFDFGKRQLTTDAKGWLLDSPDAGDKATPLSSEVAPQRITVSAFLPKQPPLNEPLWALAFFDANDQPSLGLYDATSGKLLRQLTGHTAATHSLAFSANGRLLASAADDQTIAVWGLTDLDQTISKLGLLAGLAVKEEHGALIVAQVKEGSPAKDKLKAGDVVEGLVEESRLLPQNSAAGFYFAVARLKPGATATLRVRSRDRRRDVALPVSQGADERKPLLSLFITRSAKPEDVDWIGWSPNGPYDASHPRAELFLGWHRNTGKENAPTSFVLAERHRQDYYREGILKYLVTRANLSQALDDWKENQQPIPEPDMTLKFEDADAGPAAIEGRALVQRPRVILTLAIDGLAANQIDSVQWQLDKQPAQDFVGPRDGRWTVVLSAADWERGPHEVRALVRTKESRRHEETLEFHFLPKPPVVKFDPDWLRRYFPQGSSRPVVHQNAFEVKAAVLPDPAFPRQEVQYRLEHNRQQRQLNQIFDLKLGENTLILRAVNAGAPQDTAFYETSQEIMKVIYAPEGSTAPPEVVIASVTPEVEEGKLLTPNPGQVVVNVRRVRVRGHIKSKDEDLTQASLDGTPLPGFETASQKRYRIDQLLTLKPGNHAYIFKGQTAGSKPAEAKLAIDYRPQLPQLELENTTVVDLEEGHEPFTVSLKGKLTWPPEMEERQPCQVQVLIQRKGKIALVEATLDPASASWETSMVLKPHDHLRRGLNQVLVKLSNEWKASDVQTIPVRYRRPPRILALARPKLGKNPFADIQAQFESASEVSEVELLVQSSKGGPAKRIAIPRTAWKPEKPSAEMTTWTIQAGDVPLEEGENTIRLRVRNEDGQRQSEPAKVVYSLPAPDKAAVVLDDPGRDVNVSRPRFPVHFHVQSDSPLKRVALLLDRQVVYQAKVTTVERSGKDFYFSAGEFLAALHPGDNRLQVEAVNAGGLEMKEAIISYTPRTVEIIIDRLESPQQPGKNFEWNKGDGRTLIVPRVADGKLRLHGHVTYPNRDDDRLGQETRLHIWINDHQQALPKLQAPAEGSVERAFTADVVLNRPRDNRIIVELPASLQQEEDKRRELLVEACQNPVLGQQLHLLIVGIGGDQAKEEARRRALKAVEAKMEPGTEEFTALPAFAHGRYYVPAPTGKQIAPAHVKNALRTIREKILTDRAARSVNNVVMVYYWGSVVDEVGQGHLLTTDRTPFDRDLERSALDCDKLANEFADTPVAYVLLLDVAQRQAPPKGQDLLTSWPFTHQHTGVLRYAWQGAGAVPPDARLIAALEKALAGASKLKEVADQVLETAVRLAREKYPALRGDPYYLPDGLAELVVGQKAAEEARR